MEKKFKLLPPTMPNFLSLEMPAGRREDGIKEAPKISVSDLSKEEALEYGELMKQAFINHWHTKVNQIRK